MKKSDFNELLQRYLNDQLSSDEKILLEQFFVHYEKAGQKLPLNRQNTFGTQQEILKAIEAKISAVNTSTPIRKRPFWWAAAASVLLLTGISVMMLILTIKRAPSNVEVISMAGERQEVMLPDGSTAILHGKSKISYPASFSEDKREVNLSGEAFFNVQKDATRPFVVTSGQIKTRVLGTSFSINSSPSDERITVAVATGSVRVSHGPDSVALSPGDLAVYNRKSGDLSAFPDQAMAHLGWKDNILVLQNSTLAELADDIETWFGISVSVQDDGGNCRVSGKFKSPKPEDIFKSLTLIHGVEFKTDKNNNVIILGGNCQ